MEKVIITVVGKDRVGIIAKICTYLADVNINVLDISQTIVRDFFNMVMIADRATSNIDFNKCQEDLEAIGNDLGVQIKCQKEEIFEMMHRI